jgi:hypothetical protein
MTVATVTTANVKQAVPFFGVTNMESSLRFYVEGLGFKIKHQWIPDLLKTIPTGEFAGVGLSMAPPRLCFKSFGREAGQRKLLAREPRFASCVKTLSPFIGSSNRAEFRRADLPMWGTACGLCR